MNFASFTPAFQGASNTEATLRQLQDTAQQQQARAMLTKVLQQYAQQGQGQPPSAPTPMLPATAPQPGGVSPAGGGLAPKGAVPPGGVGPVQPQGAVPSPMANAAPGIDLLRLAQAIASQGGSPGAQGYALQDMMKLLQPQANQSVKLDIAGQHDATQRYGIDTRSDTQRYGIDTRATVAEDISRRATERMQNNADKGLIKQQLADNRAQIDALVANKLPKEQVQIIASPEYQALKAERVKLIQEAQGGGKKAVDTLPNGAADSAAAKTPPETVAVQPGEPTATDAEGNTLVVRNGAWVKAQGK